MSNKYLPHWTLALVLAVACNVWLITLELKSIRCDTDMERLQYAQLAHWQRWEAIYAKVQGGMAEIGLGSMGIRGVYYDDDGQGYMVDIEREFTVISEMCSDYLQQCPPAGVIPAEQAAPQWAPEKEASFI